MATVTFDDRSFIVDEQRIWLVSGSIHYFRTPSALWRDRLLKAKRAGLNCVSTFVAWNFHEPQEGKWLLSGDHDVAAFVRMAGELGLYVILRPGPYIGADWDFGGLPGWLAAKSGIFYRTNNAAYTHYYDKYFANVLSRLAEFQVTRGGNVIAVQNENEYLVTTMPERLAYLEFVSQLVQRSGFDVPILACNHFTEPSVPGTIECVSAWDDVVPQVQRMRSRQPNAPLLVTELRCGQSDQWGGEHQQRDPRDVARKAMEVLGCGAQFNYHLWHGGTNPAFWGGRGCTGADRYQTTSYDCAAPLAEGGGLTAEYYLARLVNLLANHMGPYFAQARMAAPSARLSGTTDVLNITGPQGGWAIVTCGGRYDVESVELCPPSGVRLTVPLQPLGAAAVPVGLQLDAAHTLDYTNVTPLGLFGQNMLVLHAPVGWAVRLSINGEEIQAEIPEGDEPRILEHQEMRVVLVSSDLAMRTWFVEETLVFGPAFVGETLEDIQAPRRGKQYALLSLDGQIRHKKYPSTTTRSHPAPRMGVWTRMAVCTEPVSQDLKWQKLDRPRDLDRLGAHYGYCWYRADIKQDRAATRHLFLPECEDRATIYLNGNLVGVWGRGDGAVRAPMPAPFKRGTNVLTLLVDNLGRVTGGTRLGERKGLFGHIYDAKEIKGLRFQLKSAEGFTRRMIPRAMLHLLPRLERKPLWEASVDVSLRKVHPIHVSFTSIPGDVALLCNDRVAGFFEGCGANYGDATLGAELKQRRNRITFLIWGDVSAAHLKNIRLNALNDPISAGASWSFRPWQMPHPGGPVVGKDQPAWYTARFKYARDERPLFLHVVGAKKGQVFLNGHNLGRFWNIGPQQHYYLPECWLADENELLIFEEQGNIPRRSCLTFRPLGPYRD